MSQSLQELITPIVEMPPEEARRIFNEIVNTQPDITEFLKGKDIARVVGGNLIALGRTPDYSPIFPEGSSILRGFLNSFGVHELAELKDSLPVYLGNAAVTIEWVIHRSELSDRENNFRKPVDLPAVRLNFSTVDL